MATVLVNTINSSLNLNTDANGRDEILYNDFVNGLVNPERLITRGLPLVFTDNRRTLFFGIVLPF